MTCNFTSFSTVFQSNQYDERAIMKGVAQRNPFATEKVSTSGGARTRDRGISRPALNLPSYRGSIIAFEHLSLKGKYTGALNLNYTLQIVVPDQSSPLRLTGQLKQCKI